MNNSNLNQILLYALLSILIFVGRGIAPTIFEATVLTIMITVVGVICFAVIVGFSFNRTNYWLTNKEQKELRSININLLAAKQNLEFSKDDKLLSRKITNSLSFYGIHKSRLSILSMS